jgi:flavin reductase (DIM6/NTAB) family NADH-FMN oxidoreductase RutF
MTRPRRHLEDSMAQEAPRLDEAAKKAVLRQLTYGLYAVLTEHEGERGVFTANWLSQVSFEPPLVAVSVELDSSTLSLIRASGVFVVCPFADGQRELAGALGKPKRRAGDKFAALNLETVPTASGSPALAVALGYVVCRVVSELPAGDSVMLLGEVVEARVLNDGEPLTMRAAGFRHAG